MKKEIINYFEDAEGEVSEERSIFVKAGTNGVASDDPRLVAAEEGDKEEWFLLMSVGKVRDYSQMNSITKKHLDNIPLNAGVRNINKSAFEARLHVKKQEREQAKQDRLAAIVQKQSDKEAAKGKVRAKLQELGLTEADLETAGY